MMSRYVILFFIFRGLTLSAQKVEILQQSGFTHNYVISDLQFIEAPIDTPRLRYIATLRFSGKQDHLLTVAAWYDIIKIRAKSLGANAYLLEKYSEDASSVDMILRFYFAGVGFLKTNESKQLKNSVVIFNQTRYKPDTASFYLNTEKVEFDPASSYVFQTELLKPYYLSTNNSEVTATKIVFKKLKPSRFISFPPINILLW